MTMLYSKKVALKAYAHNALSISKAWLGPLLQLRCV